jgi:hypothetical protein
MHLVDQPPNGTFTTQELARLAVYRAAVAAGFYTDWDGSAAATDTEELAWLGGSEYPFTADERERLDRLRTDLREGRYADDVPPAPPTAAPAPPAAAPAASPEPPAAVEGQPAAPEAPDADASPEAGPPPEEPGS